jgi:hypothetical protein
MDDWDKFDTKASASVIKFNEEYASITDIYFKGANTVEYHSKNENEIKGKQINDKDLFSGVLPASIDNYHFYEKTYLSNIDEVFIQGPMFQWLDKGFVSINYNGHPVLICDYTIGQDPINILFELIKKDTDNKDNAHFSNVKLTSTFPKNDRTGFFIYNLNDYVVISENQAVCEEIMKEKAKRGFVTPYTCNRIEHIVKGRANEFESSHIKVAEYLDLGTGRVYPLCTMTKDNMPINIKPTEIGARNLN